MASYAVSLKVAFSVDVSPLLSSEAAVDVEVSVRALVKVEAALTRYPFRALSQQLEKV